MRTHVLDASALFRYLTNGEGAAIVDDLLLQASATSAPILMSAVNWGRCFTRSSSALGLPRQTS